VRPDGVIGMDVVVDAGDHLLWCGVFLDIDVIVFEAAKETFRSNIVQSLPLAIHRDLHMADAQKIQIGRIGEMTALVGVDDLGFSVAENAPQAAQDELLLQAVADLVVHYLAAVPVDDNKQVHKALLERHVGNVDSPDLIEMINNKIPQQIWPNILGMVAFAEVRAGIQGDDVHEPHQASHPLAIDFIAESMPQMVSHLAIPPGRMFQMGPINDYHDFKVLQSLAMTRIVLLLALFAVNTAAVDLSQFTLPLDR